MCKVVYSNSLLVIKSVNFAFLLRDFNRDKNALWRDNPTVSNVARNGERREKKASEFSLFFAGGTFWAKGFKRKLW